jgi:hypothetical protein
LVTLDKEVKNEKEPLVTTVSSWNKPNNNRTSPRYSRPEETSEGLKRADHSMLGTIMARRAINGRTISHHNFFSLPKNKLLRTVTMKSQNLNPMFPFSVLKSNHTKSATLNVPPLTKKRKLT